MTAVERYNALDGKTVKREDLQKIAVLGAKQGQTKISLKLFKLLEENEDAEFDIEVGEFALDEVPADALPGLNFAMPEEEFEGLGKAVSPDEIYQMITDKMLDKLKEASGKGYKKKWKTQNEEGYLLPFNFDSKKMYRGINIPLLTNGMSEVLKNPYFLTFNQIEKHGGKLKKGSKGLPVVYFTMLYAVDETNEAGEKIQFGTYNKKKFIAWLNKNIKRLRYSLDYYKNTYIPILKYYNVFNGADVEGIDFDLENFKIGFQKGTETIKNNDSRVEIADLIIANYPKPQPLLKESKNGRAYYSHNITGTVDEINMPKFEDFETGLDYYRTLLHEFTHSTGVKKRLDRPMGGKFGSKPYAKEELVAEFGAVFLSAHAGIMWYNQSNHAEYLKNWNNALTHIKDDNRFIMRAASKAQEAADYILNLDKEGVPAYQNSLKSELKNSDAKTLAEKAKEVRSKLNELSSDFQVKTNGGKNKGSNQNLEISLKKDKKFRTVHRELLESVLGKEVVNATSAIVYVGKINDLLDKLSEMGQKEVPENTDYPFSRNEIPYETAYNAHRGTSFSPEKRAKSEQESYYSFLKDTYDRLKEKARKTGRMEEFENNFPRFHDGYRKRFLKHLESKNGLMSTMITGPANFPVRKMEKKNQTIYKRLTELVDYGDKAEKYILPFKSNAIKSGKDDTISKLKSKLEELQTTHHKMKDINKVLRKYGAKKYNQEEREAGILEELSKFGYSKKEIKDNFLEHSKLPSFMLSNSNANIKRVKERIAEEERLKGMESNSYDFEGGTIHFRPEINKVQIEFDGKPEKEIRDFLKKAGQAYKWSPKNKVWQRQLNTYYRLNKTDLFKFLKIGEAEKPKEDPKPKKKNTNDLLDEARKAKLTAKTKAEFEKGLKKLGFEIVKYDSEQVNPQHWEREYILNFKDIGRVDLYLKMDKEGKKEFEGEYEFKGFGLDAESSIDYKTLPEFYEEILEDFKDVFNFTIKEAAELKKEFSHTLVSKKDASQLGLFGARAKSLRKKKGLKQPVESKPVATVPKPEPVITPQPKTVGEPQSKPVLAPQPEKPVQEVVEVGNPNSLAARMQRNKNRVIEYYNIENPDIAKFLGQVEIKRKESVGISITAPQGAGKTRFAFQLINAFAKNYKVGHASMEEHPESGLYTDKAEEYIDPENLANIDAPDINSMADVEKLIRENDVIVIDSFEKLREMDKNIQVDQDFRKKYDGKLFIFIFQLTSDGKMRGGSKSQFDVDIVLFTEKFDDYRENYIYPDKNRYNSIPPSELKFSIYNRALVPNIKEEPKENTPEEVETSKIDTGNLIFTPID